jgi:hypothetical protein
LPLIGLAVESRTGRISTRAERRPQCLREGLRPNGYGQADLRDEIIRVRDTREGTTRRGSTAFEEGIVGVAV